MEGNGFTTEDVVACSVWSRDVRLPVPPSHVVKKGFGEILEYLSGSFHDIDYICGMVCLCLGSRNVVSLARAAPSALKMCNLLWQPRRE